MIQLDSLDLVTIFGVPSEPQLLLLSLVTAHKFWMADAFNCLPNFCLHSSPANWKFFTQFQIVQLRKHETFGLSIVLISICCHTQLLFSCGVPLKLYRRESWYQSKSSSGWQCWKEYLSLLDATIILRLLQKCFHHQKEQCQQEWKTASKHYLLT